MALAADIPGLHVWADVAGVILLLELGVLLVVVTALIFGLAYGLHWLHVHVLPVLDLTVPRAKQALAIANQGNDRVVRGIAKVYGLHQGLEAALQALVRPRANHRLQQPIAPEIAARETEPDMLPVDVLAIEPQDRPATGQRQITSHGQ